MKTSGLTASAAEIFAVIAGRFSSIATERLFEKLNEQSRDIARSVQARLEGRACIQHEGAGGSAAPRAMVKQKPFGLTISGFGAGWINIARWSSESFREQAGRC